MQKHMQDATPTQLQDFTRTFPRFVAAIDKLKPKAVDIPMNVDPILAAAARIAGTGLISHAMPEQESPMPLGMVYHDARRLALHELREWEDYLYRGWDEHRMDARADIAAGKFAVADALARIDAEMEAMAKGGVK